MPVCSKCGGNIEKKEDFKSDGDVFTFAGKIPELYDGFICRSCGMMECASCRGTDPGAPCPHCGGEMAQAGEDYYMNAPGVIRAGPEDIRKASPRPSADNSNALFVITVTLVLLGAAAVFSFLSANALTLEVVCELEPLAAAGPDAMKKTVAAIGERITSLGVRNSVSAVGEKSARIMLPRNVMEPRGEDPAGETRMDEVAGILRCEEGFSVREVRRTADSASDRTESDEIVLPGIDRRYQAYYVVVKDTLLSSETLKGASLGLTPEGMKVIDLVFNEEGAKKLFEITKNNLQKRIAFIIDSKVITAPVVTQPIPGGRAQITGAQGAGFEKYLAMIRLRPLPMKIKKITVSGKSLD